ncbi:MAG TPA: cysteine dioxygenase family protein [Streptosporangiaceae bacterium]|nr:cysteine dioxygenase family protein [Streptosporangiaceae bacterium]
MPAATHATTPPAPPSRCPAGLTAAIRQAVRAHSDWGQTAQLVAGALGRERPGPEILTAAERAGHPGGYQTHLMHAEPDGSFSIVAVVWRPGQLTPVHDHVTWCVAGVLQGAEDEELFALVGGGTALRPAGRALTRAGSVTGFAPPGDIHRVRNPGPGMTVSLHVYGADITRLGSSVRRVYELPVRA